MLIVPEALIAVACLARRCLRARSRPVSPSMARGEAYNFPVVREALGEGRQYGFKSGLDRAAAQLGVKAGGYFPGNAAKGMINHQSTVFLFDPDTGRPVAMVGGNLLTALRTAAASAISIDRLARPDAQVLGMVGAGHQAGFQLRAAARVRRFERVIAWNLHPDMLPKLGAVAAELGLPFEAVDLERMGRGGCDHDHHLVARGSLLADACVARARIWPAWAPTPWASRRWSLRWWPRATVFTDEVAQSVTHRRGAARGGGGAAGRERDHAAWARC